VGDRNRFTPVDRAPVLLEGRKNRAARVEQDLNVEIGKNQIQENP
jgi:hypothetical protein